jgi:hypothetical protein
MMLDQNVKTDCRNGLLLPTAAKGLLRGTNCWNRLVNGLFEPTPTAVTGLLHGTNCWNRLVSGFAAWNNCWNQLM